MLKTNKDTIGWVDKTLSKFINVLLTKYILISGDKTHAEWYR